MVSSLGIDYGGGTFAQACRLQNIHRMLAITAELDYKAYMLDLQTAFLNADEEEEVFVKCPPEYELSNKAGVPSVMKLKKSIYGLRQSSKNWFDMMEQCLGGIEFRPFKPHPCVYIYEGEVSFVILTLYVDDLLLLSANKLLLSKLSRSR